MGDTLIETIRRGAFALHDFAVATRRDIHAHPELGNQETRTPRVIVDDLTGLDLEMRQHVGGTGVVATLRGAHPGPTLALRADMDALPLQEEDPRPYRSCVPGVMHACGHDGHVAMLLGAAHLLHGLREHLHGNVKFLFQPAEETYGGASEMIADGCLSDEPKVDAIFGLHLEPEGNVGELWLRPGPTMASSDAVRIVVQGIGGHASEPYACVDPVPIAAQIITNLQTLVTRRFDARSPVVVTITYLQGGNAFNVIPSEVILAGTVRTLDPTARAQVPQRITEVAEHAAAAFGATAEVTYLHGSGVVVNDASFTQFVTDAVRRYRGAAAVREAPSPVMSAEDFGLYLEHVPGTFAFLGARPSHQEAFPCHHPRFDIDEAALPVGIQIFAAVTVDYLRER